MKRYTRKKSSGAATDVFRYLRKKKNGEDGQNDPIRMKVNERGEVWGRENERLTGRQLGSLLLHGGR